MLVFVNPRDHVIAKSYTYTSEQLFSAHTQPG